jgi:hypothetical protein
MQQLNEAMMFLQQFGVSNYSVKVVFRQSYFNPREKVANLLFI